MNMKHLSLILVLAVPAFGNITYDDFVPSASNTWNLGSATYQWKDAFGDGTLDWDTITDGTLIITGGIVTVGIWNGSAIDMSDYTNLTAGTNITLSGDTLNVDDAFLVNNANDTTTGTLTAGGFTTAGTMITDVLIAGSNVPANSASAGTAGTITWNSDYIYVCVASNSWKRAGLSTWGTSDVLLLNDGTSKLLLDDGSSFLLIRP